MCQYIDMKKIIYALPDEICSSTSALNSSKHSTHPDIHVRFPICVSSEEVLDVGETKLVETCTIILVDNIPSSYYMKFEGINTNIGLHTLSGILKNDFSGYFYAKAHNSSTEVLRIPSGICIGSLVLKKYYDN